MERLQRIKYKKNIMQSGELDSRIPRESPWISPLLSCYLNRNPERKKEKRDRRDLFDRQCVSKASVRSCHSSSFHSNDVDRFNLLQYRR